MCLCLHDTMGAAKSNCNDWKYTPCLYLHGGTALLERMCWERDRKVLIKHIQSEPYVIAAAVNSGLTADRLFHFSYSLLCVFVCVCLLTIESGLWTEHWWSRQDQVFWREPGQSWRWLQGSWHSLGTWSGEWCGCQHLLRSPPWGQGLS